MGRLIVGLGNPGREYENTRHNIGWDAIDKMGVASDLNWQEKFKGLYAATTMSGEKVYFLKPQTFMNLSGESVAPLVKFFKVEISEVLVVHDELDLPFGTIAFKQGGGLAGHNGLKSIAKCLGTQDFRRLRMGIGRPPRGSVSNWVLSTYDKDDTAVLETYLDGSADALELFMKEGFGKAAQKYSKKKII